MKPGDRSFGLEEAAKAGRTTQLINQFVLARTCDTNTIPGSLTVEKDGKLEVSRLENDTPPTYGAFYRILLGALEGKNSVPVDAREARNVIRLVEIARESSEKGTTVSINSDHFLKV